jgi:hypothetical protein
MLTKLKKAKKILALASPVYKAIPALNDAPEVRGIRTKHSRQTHALL